MNKARRSSGTEPSRIERSHNFGGCIPKAERGMAVKSIGIRYCGLLYYFGVFNGHPLKFIFGF